jgi:hypothetical protein
VHSQILALTASLVATRAYFASDPAVPVMEEGYAWTIVGSLSASWLCVFAAFLMLMERPFLGTFTSTQTGYAWVQSRFLANDADLARSRIFGANRKQWLSIRPDVKDWTIENWERWEDEKPPFFTDAWKAGVDDDMIPAESLRRMNGGGSARRRSSLGDVLGVGARVAPVGGGGAQ